MRSTMAFIPIILISHENNDSLLIIVYLFIHLFAIDYKIYKM